jgi:hypothetical protein
VNKSVSAYIPLPWADSEVVDGCVGAVRWRRMDAHMDDRVFGLVSNRVRWAGTPSSSTLALRSRPILARSVLELE